MCVCACVCMYIYIHIDTKGGSQRRGALPSSQDELNTDWFGRQGFDQTV